jgi:hypothetical protein
MPRGRARPCLRPWPSQLASQSPSIHLCHKPSSPPSAAPGGHAACGGRRLVPAGRRAPGGGAAWLGSRSPSILRPGAGWRHHPKVVSGWDRAGPGLLLAGTPSCSMPGGARVASPGEPPPRRSPPVDQARRHGAAPPAAPAGPSGPLRPRALTLTAWNGRCRHHCSFSDSCPGLIWRTDSSGRPRSRTLASRPCRAAWSTMGPQIRAWPGASPLTWRPSNQLDQ